MTGSSPAPVRSVEVDLDGVAASEHLEFRDAAAGDVDITKAEFLLSIGRGVEDKDNIPRFEKLAERLGATLSVSRPLVDAGWAPSARQVPAKPMTSVNSTPSPAVRSTGPQRNTHSVRNGPVTSV